MFPPAFSSGRGPVGAPGGTRPAPAVPRPGGLSEVRKHNPSPSGWAKGGLVSSTTASWGPGWQLFSTSGPPPPPPPDQTGDLKKRPMRGEGVSARSFPPVHSHVGHRRLRPPPLYNPTHREGGGGGSRRTLAVRTSSTSRSSPRASPAAPGAHSSPPLPKTKESSNRSSEHEPIKKFNKHSHSARSPLWRPPEGG